jgi:4-carboxymuconolactone decarboxylase
MPVDSISGTFGRFHEVRLDEMPAAAREGYELTKKLRGLVPGRHMIWLANPALSKTIVPTGACFQTQSSLTKSEIRSPSMS